ncbi:MAG: insulinase family protein, partial [Bacteroidales bacterium]|nr:insulinase family protein [Bacteroidales bacterium]
TAMGQYSQPGDLDGISQNISYIACGKDKLIQSIEAFDELLDNMPENEPAFQIAKESVINSYRTSRITEKGMVSAYLGWKELGLKEDPRKATFEGVQRMTLKDIKQFQKDYVSGQPRTIALIGTVKDMDMKALKKYGKVKVLKQKTVFGY